MMEVNVGIIVLKETLEPRVGRRTIRMLMGKAPKVEDWIQDQFQRGIQ